MSKTLYSQLDRLVNTIFHLFTQTKMVLGGHCHVTAGVRRHPAQVRVRDGDSESAGLPAARCLASKLLRRGASLSGFIQAQSAQKAWPKSTNCQAPAHFAARSGRGPHPDPAHRDLDVSAKGLPSLQCLPGPGGCCCVHRGRGARDH